MKTYKEFLNEGFENDLSKVMKKIKPLIEDYENQTNDIQQKKILDKIQQIIAMYGQKKYHDGLIEDQR